MTICIYIYYVDFLRLRRAIPKIVGVYFVVDRNCIWIVSDQDIWILVSGTISQTFLRSLYIMYDPVEYGPIMYNESW